jgi:hypothetical protein
MGKLMLDGLRIGQGAATLAVFDALDSYLDDYKQPKGSLRVTLNPPGKISGAALAAMTTPDEAIAALGLVVSYAGTRPQGQTTQTAQTAPAAPDPVGVPGKGECAPGARYFVMHEEAWWSVTVREPSKSGATCIARIDGGSDDDDVTFALEKTLPWSLDGPGKPAAACSSGDKVLVESDGGWYPAKVTKASEGGKCPIKYETSDGDEETVALKRVRRLD